MAALNMYRREINIHEKEMCAKLVIYKDYTKMHGQQNIKVKSFFAARAQKFLHYTWLVRVSGKRGSTSENPGSFPSEAGHSDRP